MMGRTSTGALKTNNNTTSCLDCLFRYFNNPLNFGSHQKLREKPVTQENKAEELGCQGQGEHGQA